ncbi:hypothetical protein ACQKMD_17270 [Viridibacillus sp. NPDC096237]
MVLSIYLLLRFEKK